MKKLNNKGFMLMELLVVTVAILIVFTAIYINYYPTLGEYEERIVYNDIDSLYRNYYLRVFLLKNNNYGTLPITNNFKTLVENGKCINITSKQSDCDNLVSNLGITSAILTNYNISSLKNNNNVELNNFKDYLSYLPNYSKSNKKEYYRLIVKTDNSYSNMQFFVPTGRTAWSSWGFNVCATTNDIECEQKSIIISPTDNYTCPEIKTPADETTNTLLNNVRYIKDCMNGNNMDPTHNHWVEIQAIYQGNNVAKLYGSVTGPTTDPLIGSGSSGNWNTIIDGNTTTGWVAGSNPSGYQCVIIDLGEGPDSGGYNLDEIRVWHYWGDGRTYYDNITYVSSDGTSYVPVINTGNVAETSQGKKVSSSDAITCLHPFTVSDAKKQKIKKVELYGYYDENNNNTDFNPDTSCEIIEGSNCRKQTTYYFYEIPENIDSKAETCDSSNVSCNDIYRTRGIIKGYAN